MKKKNPVEVLVFHSHGVGQLITLPYLPKEGETIWSYDWNIGNDGAKGSNVAVALEKLGVHVAFSGKVGTDVWSHIGMQYLENSNISLDYLLFDPETKTQIGIVLVDEAGKNSIILGGDCAKFTEKEIHACIDAYPEASYFITGFEIQTEDALEAAKYAKFSGKYVILNPSPVPATEIHNLSFVDLLILNQPESEYLLKQKGVLHTNKPQEQLLALRQLYHCNNIIITLGSQGCALLASETIHLIPAAPVKKTIDTSGAGDSFLAAVAYGLVHGLSLFKSCELGSIYAAQTVQYSGTFPAFRSIKEMREISPAFSLPSLL